MKFSWGFKVPTKQLAECYLILHIYTFSVKTGNNGGLVIIFVIDEADPGVQVTISTRYTYMIKNKLQNVF